MLHTAVIAAHATTALVALLLGGYLLLRRVKGDLVHRVAGGVWSVGMLFVATSSFAIRELRSGHLSLLHVLSAVTVVSLVVGLAAARRHKLRWHRAAMRGSWFGLVGAFVGAVAVPGRRVPSFTVSHPLGALAAAGAIIVASAALIVAAHAVDRWRSPAALARDAEAHRRGRVTTSPAARP